MQTENTFTHIAISLNINADMRAEIQTEPITVNDEKRLLLTKRLEPTLGSLNELTMKESLLEHEASNGIKFGISFLCASLLLGIGSLTFMSKEDKGYAVIPIIAMAVIGALYVGYGCIQKCRRLRR